MMRISIVIIFFFFVVFNGYTQDNSSWRLGLKASPSISWIWPEIRELNYEETDFGFSYGIIIDKYFTENYAVSSGFFVTHQGGRLSFDEIRENENILGENTENRIYDLQYLDIPIALKMRTREIGYFTYYGQFGLSFGYNVRARADDEFFGGNREEELDILDEKSPLKASLIMGAGAEYSLLGNTAIVMGLYYNNCFSNILDTDPDTFEGKKISAKANFVELTIAMMF